VILDQCPPVDQLTEIPTHVREEVTRSPLKADLYALDSYFREGCWTFADALPDMLGVALCMMKSEATAGRRLRSGLAALADVGFRPVDAVRFRHNRQTIREVWRYQFNIATRERVEAMDAVLPSTDTVCLVLWDEQWEPGRIPAAVRLNSLKGPADPALRRPEHLRHRLGVVNGLFNFLHISDEPIDVIREIAVLCDEPRRLAMLDRIRARHDARPEVFEIFDALERQHPEHDFDLDRSWQRLAQAPGAAGDLARRRAAGEQPDIHQALAAVGEVPLDAPYRWDVLTVVTHLLEVMNVPGVAPAVPNVDVEWAEASR
jgi:hypothetical protein